ncbi:RNA binding protein, heterogenous nuclear RNP-K like protein [Fusarium oxysporum]|nr:RNA binding protein, heterogenous nuclear RNP-K like protein [Fusarium oxysporum]
MPAAPLTGGAPVVGTTQPTINHRLLLSLKEAAKIIGTKGSTISRIRAANSVKIGISEKVPGCSDRILSCAGNVINVANAIGDIVDVLNKRNPKMRTQLRAEAEEHYYFHFLNHILPAPSKDEIRDLQQLEDIGYVRLIVANSISHRLSGKQAPPSSP